MQTLANNDPITIACTYVRKTGTHVCMPEKAAILRPAGEIVHPGIFNFAILSRAACSEL